MAINLRITQAKPNPAGKDKTAGGLVKPEQLLGEWVDIQNIGNEAIKFSAIHLNNALYNSRCQPTGQSEPYWSGGNEMLKPGQTIRVFTGKQDHQNLIPSTDRGSVEWFGFANRGNFVLNNRCGDIITVIWQEAQDRQYQDSASYAPNLPEGAVLRRVGDKLVL